MRTGFTTTILSLLAAALLSVALVTLSTPPKNVSHSAQGVPVADADDSFSYVLGEYSGRLAVFSRGSQDPDLVFDVYLQALPDFDRMQLESGVAAKDYTELVALIEDYTS